MKPNDPHALSREGGRSQNQDCVFPAPDKVNSKDRLFVVCDGVGGAARGEVASGMVCKRFPLHLGNLEMDQPATEDFQQALDMVSSDMRDYVQKEPAAASMATTFAMVHVGKMQLTIAWCGDSRVYLVRKGKILYHTFDHSLVGEMVAAGRLTWEEARTHPRNNIVSRTVNAETDARADFKVYAYDELKANDYLFLCSDGVQEIFSNTILEKLMDGRNKPRRIAHAIDEKCRWESSDNYSFIIFQLAGREK